MIALPARPARGEAPPTELLEEDAREFAVRRGTIADLNRRELA